MVSRCSHSLTLARQLPGGSSARQFNTALLIGTVPKNVPAIHVATQANPKPRSWFQSRTAKTTLSVAAVMATTGTTMRSRRIGSV